MGLEQHLFKVYLGHSEALKKRWVIKAQSIEEASGIIIAAYRDLLNEMDNNAPEDIDIDLQFEEIEKEFVEI